MVLVQSCLCCSLLTGSVLAGVLSTFLYRYLGHSDLFCGISNAPSNVSLSGFSTGLSNGPLHCPSSTQSFSTLVTLQYASLCPSPHSSRRLNQLMFSIVKFSVWPSSFSCGGQWKLKVIQKHKAKFSQIQNKDDTKKNKMTQTQNPNDTSIKQQGQGVWDFCTIQLENVQLSGFAHIAQLYTSE